MTDTDPTTAEAPAPVVQFKKRAPKGKAVQRKRPATPKSDSDDSDFSSDNDDPTIKRRKKNSGAIKTSSAGQRPTHREEASEATSANPTPQIQSNNDATKHSNWYDEEASDAKALLGNTRPMNKDAESSKPDGTYKGLANQTSFIQKNPDAPKKSFGPLKAPTNVRTTTFFDYAPDVCKDYKLTGYCGFGDSCVFLHDRGDYKRGWELDREWENVTKGGQKPGGTIVARADREAAGNKGQGDDDDDIPQDIPFACIICQGPYRDPIVTKCGHYFCESCALGRYKKDPSCMACGAGTGGVFNTARQLNRILEKKRRKEESRAE